MGDKIPEFLHAGNAEFVIHHFVFPAAVHQPHITEDFHVVAERRLRNINLFQDTVCGHFLAGKHIDNTQAVGIGQCLEGESLCVKRFHMGPSFNY